MVRRQIPNAVHFLVDLLLGKANKFLILDNRATQLEVAVELRRVVRPSKLLKRLHRASWSVECGTEKGTNISVRRLKIFQGHVTCNIFHSNSNADVTDSDRNV